jgi:hypothetical protein
MRLRRVGSWDRDPLTDLAAACRTTVAIDKALGESIAHARRAGRSWPEIATALGLPASLTTWDEISQALAEARRYVWSRYTDE